MGCATLGFTKYVPFSLVEREHLYSNRQQTPNPDAQEPCVSRMVTKLPFKEFLHKAKLYDFLLPREAILYCTLIF
jgi:hypothetical protein